MDIHTQVEIVLREAGYDTWPWESGAKTVTCFEGQAVVGFVHVFDSCETLLGRWRESQQAALQRFAPVLRPTGAKAWNVYSVFLSPELGNPSQIFEIEKIEEDFALTRKIARANVCTAADVGNAMLSLLPVRSFVAIGVTDYEAQLRKRMSGVSEEVATAFLGNRSVSEIASLLLESA